MVSFDDIEGRGRSGGDNQHDAQELAAALRRKPGLAERVAELQRAIDDLLRRLDEQDHHLAGIELGIASFDTRVDRNATGVEAVYERLRCVEGSVEQQRQLTDQHFEARVIEPLVRRIFSVIDLLGPDRPPHQTDESRRTSADVQNAIRTELLALLAGYGVEPVGSEPGSHMDPRLMRPARTRWTDDHALDMTVAECVRTGRLFIDTGLVLQTRSVAFPLGYAFLQSSIALLLEDRVIEVDVRAHLGGALEVQGDVHESLSRISTGAPQYPSVTLAREESVE